VPSFPTSREAWRWPFTARSAWNLPVGDGLILADDACTAAVRDTSHDAWMNAEEWSHPVFRAVETDPSVDAYEEEVLRATFSAPEDAEPSLPAYPEGDAHLYVVDPSSTQITEMWRARRRNDGGFDVDSLATIELRGTGIGTDGVRIYGGSGVAGLWRTGEAASGAYHALALSLPLAVLAPRAVWPATDLSTSREDQLTGVIPVGQHVALPPDTPLSVARTPAGRALVRTLRDYGAYVVDHAAGFALYAEPSAVAEAEQIRDDIDAIRARLQCSTNVTAETPGGPGERVAPLAPPFDDE
jgi:hypothetical protein